MSPRTRAQIATTIFVVAALCAVFLSPAPRGIYMLLHVALFAGLVINTFYSVRFFTPLIPRTRSHAVMETVLAVLNIALGLSIGFPIGFAYFATLLFIFATATYAIVLLKTPHDTTLRKKILIDLIGAAHCAIALGIVLWGFPLLGTWFLVLGFSVANIYLLAIRPMYRKEF